MTHSEIFNTLKNRRMDSAFIKWATEKLEAEGKIGIGVGIVKRARGRCDVGSRLLDRQLEVVRLAEEYLKEQKATTPTTPQPPFRESAAVAA